MTNPAAWSIEGYCLSQEPLAWSSINHETTRNFLLSFDLPTVHPFCENYAHNFSEYYLPDVPRQGPLTSLDHMETIWDTIVTVGTLAVSSLAAMGELWLRFFAFLIAPFCVAALLAYEMQRETTTTEPSTTDKHARCNTWFVSSASVLSVASSIVLLTDTGYISEFGPRLGATLLALSSILAFRMSGRHGWTWPPRIIAFLLMLCVYLVVDWKEDGSIAFHFGEPAEQYDLREGLYFDSQNSILSQTAQYWSSNDWSYTYGTGATPWMSTGDTRTGLPFLLNRIDEPLLWHRLWLTVPGDQEVVALDFTFPFTGYDDTKPVYMVLHGINGGTQEQFIRDFALRRTAEKATVVVMIARGLEDLPIRGWNNFHGARWTDAHAASQAIKRVLSPNQLLAGVGYSMGAIILTNLVGRAGPECALDVAVAVSGGLDMRFQKTFYRAQRLFQPVITVKLRDEFVLGKWGDRVRARLTKDQMKALMRGTHITDIDSICIVNYNGFRDVDHYYSEMSLLGDVPMSEYTSPQGIDKRRRVHQITTPTLVIQAMDDPLITWRSVASNHGAMHPTKLVQTGNGNLMLLLTKRGGHVGWSTGVLPHLQKWKWMNDAVATFVEAFIKAKRHQQEQQ